MPEIKIHDDKIRAFEMAIDVEAAPDDVWRALTEADELVRWFPLQARVTPGRGGTMSWSWGDAWQWDTTIDAWEPQRRLRLVQERAEPNDAEGRPLPSGTTKPARIALEITLESHAGRTRVRLVHSGFERGAGWDDEFDGISGGWQFELRSLAYYLSRHRGRDRYAALARATTPAAREEVWKKLVGPDGYRVDAPTLKEGGPYTLTAPDGERFSGTVLCTLPGRQFAGTVRELDDGIIRIETWRGGGQTGAMVWLATYGAQRERVDAFERRAQEVLDRHFAATDVRG
jgi:uncharacterized protein YndB with AHSA1/START domain